MREMRTEIGNLPMKNLRRAAIVRPSFFVVRRIFEEEMK